MAPISQAVFSMALMSTGIPAFIMLVTLTWEHESFFTEKRMLLALIVGMGAGMGVGAFLHQPLFKTLRGTPYLDMLVLALLLVALVETLVKYVFLFHRTNVGDPQCGFMGLALGLGMGWLVSTAVGISILQNDGIGWPQLVFIAGYTSLALLSHTLTGVLVGLDARDSVPWTSLWRAGTVQLGADLLLFSAALYWPPLVLLGFALFPYLWYKLAHEVLADVLPFELQKYRLRVERRALREEEAEEQEEKKQREERRKKTAEKPSKKGRRKEGGKRTGRKGEGG